MRVPFELEEEFQVSGWRGDAAACSKNGKILMLDDRWFDESSMVEWYMQLQGRMYFDAVDCLRCLKLNSKRRRERKEFRKTGIF